MKLEANKENAQSFYDLMFNQCDPRRAIEAYAGEEYIQHNPEVADGRDAFIEYFERMVVEHWDVLQIIPGEAKNGNSMF
ncbi:MAG: putative SnoaL-like aldol condensation-catalyzing enzyme [Limisphaerales bacterium]|jgi:predicted SnoaL-like aldol condensation-catalyzing enzyme